SGGRIFPPILSRGLLRISGIKDAVLVLTTFPHHQQSHFARGVVEETVADTGAGREADRIAWAQSMQLAIEPDIRRPCDHIHEFLFNAFGVRIRGSTPGEEALMVNADPRETEMPPETGAYAHELVVAVVMGVVCTFNQGPVRDVRGAS